MVRKTVVFFLVLSLYVGFCGKSRTGVEQLFPEPGFEEGWDWLGVPERYGPENLFEYIDGEAELYLKYGFQELATLTYSWESAEDTFFVVDVYEMGTPLNAFGLYSNYRYPGYEYEEIGTEGFVSDYGVKFYQGRYVVELRAGDTSERCRRAVRRAARQISERIGGTLDPPQALAFLPSEGQVDKTLRYIADVMLNQEFLPGGLEARYRIDGEEVMGFVVLFQTAEEAREGYRQLRAYFEDEGRTVLPMDALGPDVFGVETPYHGHGLFALEGRFLAGVQDLSALNRGEGLMETLKDRLRERLTGEE